MLRFPLSSHWIKPFLEVSVFTACCLPRNKHISYVNMFLVYEGAAVHKPVLVQFKRLCHHLIGYAPRVPRE